MLDISSPKKINSNITVVLWGGLIRDCDHIRIKNLFIPVIYQIYPLKILKSPPT